MLTNFAMLIAIIVFALCATVFAALWVYNDAKKRGLQAGMWVLLVLLSGNFIGLILYLLIGKKQERAVCSRCGELTSAQGAFCSSCGEKIEIRNKAVSTNKGFLFACAACIVLVFVSFGAFFFTNFTADGFMFERKYSWYHTGLNGSAKNVSASSSGDKWELSFEETSEGYTFKKTYNAVNQPVLLSVDISCQGSVQLLVEQNEVAIDEIIQEGHFTFDLTDFETGKISIQIINIGASDFSGTFIIKA